MSQPILQPNPKREIETEEELLELVKDLDGPIIIEVKALSEKGDEQRIMWDPRNLDEMKEARDKFYELLDSGYQAFAVNLETGEANKRKIIKFDPNAGDIVFKFREVVEHAKQGRKTIARPAIVGG